MIGTILLVLLILLLLGGIPAVGLHSQGWYPYGSGAGLLIAIILVIVLLRGA